MAENLLEVCVAEHYILMLQTYKYWPIILFYVHVCSFPTLFLLLWIANA